MSAPPPGHDQAAIAEAVARLIQALGLDPAAERFAAAFAAGFDSADFR